MEGSQEAKQVDNLVTGITMASHCLEVVVMGYNQVVVLVVLTMADHSS